MPNRKRSYAELAGTILLWVQEETTELPFTWTGHVLRRQRYFDAPDTPGPLLDCFRDTSEETARSKTVRTVEGSLVLSEYAHRLGELTWMTCNESEADWGKRVREFLATGRMEASAPDREDP